MPAGFGQALSLIDEKGPPSGPTLPLTHPLNLMQPAAPPWRGWRCDIREGTSEGTPTDLSSYVNPRWVSMSGLIYRDYVCL